MEYLMGFIAGVAVGVGVIGIIAVHVRMKLEEENIKLRVELKYAKQQEKGNE